MQISLDYKTLAGGNGRFLGLLAALGLFTACGAAAVFYTEANGHWVTGMTNAVPWGMPLAAATFMILAASGALNVASVGSVFEQADYQPFGRLGCLLAAALLTGGLAILSLDLGEPDQIPAVLEHQNFTSVFSLNVIIYSVFFGLIALYLGAQMIPQAKILYKPVAFAAFVWRLGMTTGTGLIFGLLASRIAYHSALMAPMFIALSLSFGLAAFVLVAAAVRATTGLGRLSAPFERRLRRLLAVFVAVSLYMVVVQHLAGLYAAEQRPFETFILARGGAFSMLLWGGFVLLGSVLPLGLLVYPDVLGGRYALTLASLLVLLGGVALIYVIVLAAQVFPMELAAGYTALPTSFDGSVATYVPSLPEFGLSLGGVGVAGLVLAIGLRILPLLPTEGR